VYLKHIIVSPSLALLYKQENDEAFRGSVNKISSNRIKRQVKHQADLYKDHYSLSNLSLLCLPLSPFLFHTNRQLCEDLFTKFNDNNTDNNMSYSVEVRLGRTLFSILLFGL